MNQIPPQDKQLSAFNQQVRDVRGRLDKMTDDLSSALSGSGVSVDRFKRTAISAIQTNPDLLQCDRRSLFGAIVLAAQLGLVLDRALGEAAIVPFGGKATLVPEYRGLQKLAYQTGLVKSITAELVYWDDEFDLSKGDDARIVHKPDPDAHGDRKIRGAYAIAELMTGGIVREWMNKAAIDEVKAKSPGARRKDSLWQVNYPAMARKTPLRSLLDKRLPKSTDALARAASLAGPGQGIVAYEANGDLIVDEAPDAAPSAEALIEANASSPDIIPQSDADELGEELPASEDEALVVIGQSTGKGANGTIKVTSESGLFAYVPGGEARIDEGMVSVPSATAALLQDKWQKEVAQ